MVGSIPRPIGERWPLLVLAAAIASAFVLGGCASLLPASRNGEPYAQWYRLRVVFKLKNQQ